MITVRRGAGSWLALVACLALAGCGVEAADAGGEPDATSSPATIPSGAPPAALEREAPQARLDIARMLSDVEYLASDALEGRRTGTPGNAAARAHIVAAFTEIGLRPIGNGYTHPFALAARGGSPGRGDAPAAEGVNVIGYVPGREQPDRWIVITAHYDHLGVQAGEIFNGADDNASGTAGLLALARYFQANPPANTIAFAALDAEEQGLLGARAFLAAPTVPRERIALNVNLDMVSRSDRGELYVAGTYHYPFLLPYVEEVADRAVVALRTGHDRPDLPPGDDWTNASDHGPFHAEGIPFLYFGVEDHADYHRPTDEFRNIDPSFYGRAMETVLDAVLVLDRELDAILARRASATASP